MKWGNYDLNWGRPLKSILCVFDKKVINFSLGHLRSSNFTYLDKDFEEKKKIFTDFISYQKYFEKVGTILDQEKRKDFIKKAIEKVLKKKKSFLKSLEKVLKFHLQHCVATLSPQTPRWSKLGGSGLIRNP